MLARGALALAALYSGLVGALYLAQDRLLYPAAGQPVASITADVAGFETLRLATPDGERLVVWWKAPEEGKMAILCFPGNDDPFNTRRERASVLGAKGYGVLMVAYRGFWGSTGRPHEAGLHTDARTAYEWLASRVPPSRIVLFDELIANPRTGSILIRHQKLVDLLDLLASEGSVMEVQTGNLGHTSQTIDRAQISTAVPELVDITAVGLGGLGIYQAARGQVAGTALEHFWSAYGSFRTLRSPTLALGFAGLGLYQLMRGQLIEPAASLFYYALAVRYIAGGDASHAPEPRGDRLHSSDQV
jgi:hypothetical protein